MIKKLIGICMLVVVVALVLTLTPACGKGEEPGGTTPAKSTPTPQTKVLQMGMMGPLSGPAAAWGAQNEQGAKWAADIINEAGGIKVGGVTYTIKIVSCDDKFTGSEAATCAAMFVSERSRFTNTCARPTIFWAAK